MLASAGQPVWSISEATSGATKTQTQTQIQTKATSREPLGFFALQWQRVTRFTNSQWVRLRTWLAPPTSVTQAMVPPRSSGWLPDWAPLWLKSFFGQDRPKGMVPDSEGKFVIAIDPGHGGSDPGAIARDGWPEKQLTLAIAKQLKQRLESRGIFRVVLTRTDDSRIELTDRVNLARADGAMIFISLHANVYEGDNANSVTGAMVFTLTKEATDSVAAKIAASENSVNTVISGNGLRGGAELVPALVGLEQRETRRQSIQLARLTVQEFNRQGLPLNDNPVRGDNLVVLRSPAMPSILVEMGFLSSPSDERRLRSPQGQAQIVAALARAIERSVQSQIGALAVP
ncbi:MAG: N-acetylmuramoyl-L-alanine amidase [Candidatus Pacebacteria bacterium]|nr:N-acetylmuramoyl-L-alanine amidase [Candidatus Paceibacterota bacterium]